MNARRWSRLESIASLRSGASSGVVCPQQQPLGADAAGRRGERGHARTLGAAVSASYAALLGLRPARRLVYALVVTTLSYGMLSLTVVLTVERSTGSYREAGFAVAAFALFAALPRRSAAALIDRRGARIWLPALASGYAASLVALDLAAHAGARALGAGRVRGRVGRSARRRSSPPRGRSGVSSSTRCSSAAGTR